MLIGDKKSFAVEFELDNDFNGAWLFGKICFWISGMQVGDYELGASLRDVMPSLQTIVKDCERRDLEGLSSVTAALLVDAELYGDPLPASAELEMPARFNVCPEIDVFDEWKIYLFDFIGHSEIVYWRTGEEKESVTLLPKGCFDRVIRDVYGQVDALYAGQI